MKFYYGDILDLEVDGLISTGNPQLNMSGGINGALLLQYGGHLQDELHSYLKSTGTSNVEPGFIYKFKNKIGSYKSVTYSVGIDGWYNSSIELAAKTISDSIKILVDDECTSIAFGAIGTGYGHMSKADFGKALSIIEGATPDNINLFLAEQSELGLDDILDGYSGLVEKIDSNGTIQG